MRVTLVNQTENPIETIATVASICYGKNYHNSPEKLFRFILNNGHNSPLEFATFTFKIEGISRACMGQLVRYRHSSPMVRSQRYCDESETDVIIPPSIEENQEALDIYNEAVEYAKNAYNSLLDLGIKREDSRFILPEGNSTTMYLQVNLREMFHIYEQRCDKSAQWEVRNVVYAMWLLLPVEIRKVYDSIFGGTN